MDSSSLAELVRTVEKTTVASKAAQTIVSSMSSHGTTTSAVTPTSSMTRMRRSKPMIVEPIEEEDMVLETSSDDHDQVNQELSKIDEEKNKRLSQIPAIPDPKLLNLAKPYSALIQETFTSIDATNCGLVEIDDAERVLFGFNTRFGKNMSKEEIRAYCHLLDADGDSRIDLEQFSSAFMNCAI